METVKPPVHLREQVFRLYERFIREAVKMYPSQLVIDTKFANNCACGLRHAMRSLALYKWQTDIPMDKFLELYQDRQLKVREHENKVTVGGYKTIEPKASGLIIKPNNSEELLFSVTLSQAMALCQAASRRLLTQPILLTGEELNDMEMAELHHGYDVVIEKVNENTWLLE